MLNVRRLGVLLALLAGTACLQKDTTSTIYLRPDGSLDWVVLDRNVRSDATSEAERTQEEGQYRESAERGEHGAALAVRALGATRVRSLVIRATRPYAVVVEGTFDNLATLASGPLIACGVPHETAITRVDDVATWRLRADLSHNGGDFGPAGCEKPFEGLLEALDVEILLESGRFTHAVGFTIERPDRAVPDQLAFEQAALERNDGWLVLSLSWTLPQTRR